MPSSVWGLDLKYRNAYPRIAFAASSVAVPPLDLPFLAWFKVSMLNTGSVAISLRDFAILDGEAENQRIEMLRMGERLPLRGL